MFNLGLSELLVIGVVGLLFFGPKRLPELAKALGQGLFEFKKAMEGTSEKKSDTAVCGDEQSDIISSQSLGNEIAATASQSRNDENGERKAPSLPNNG